MLEVRLLGEFHLVANGSEIRFRAPEKALELLAFLLVRRGPIERGRIAEQLWPDKDVDDARTELRRHLYYLATRALPEGVPWIAGDKRTIEWNDDAPTSVDLTTFVSLATSDPAAALALYCGDLLPAVEARVFPFHARSSPLRRDVVVGPRARDRGMTGYLKTRI